MVKLFNEQRKTFIFVLCGFSHYSEIGGFVRQNVTLPGRNRYIKSRYQPPVIRILVPYSLGSTVTLSAFNRVVELLKSGL